MDRVFSIQTIFFVFIATEATLVDNNDGKVDQSSETASVENIEGKTDHSQVDNNDRKVDQSSEPVSVENIGGKTDQSQVDVNESPSTNLPQSGNFHQE